ncbi:unnamed protein product [Gongylonema pulchrum]|uniref:Histidine acid phosphatase n=1 Tax=Gongylonema pulchrum TaxID=637853 RepID=A0A183DSS6_9BILA|nr:unnamed protein product [Gongylonema pulchrum]
MRKKPCLELLFSLFGVISAQGSVEELLYVQAVWRHGDRAPSKLPYPNDVNNETMWPRGWSQLTNVLTAIWRHGDRAPSKLPYPNDENNETMWPRGWSQLTNVLTV